MSPLPETSPIRKPEAIAGPRRWTILWRGLLALAVVLPIGLLSWYSVGIVGRSLWDLVRANNQAAGVTTAELVEREMDQCIALARTVATLPSFVELVEHHEEEAVRLRLERVVAANPRMDRAFVTDPAGVLWSDYPKAPESLGRDFSQRDWYRGLSGAWKPYISEVYRRNAEPKWLVVAVAVPIRGSAGPVVGALVCQYRLDEISHWLKQITVGHNGYVYVVDHTGTVAAHPRLDVADREHEEYRAVPPVQRALQGEFETAQYRDPLAQQTMVATFRPAQVAGQRWVVVAQQPLADARATIRGLQVQIGLAAALMTLLAMAAVAWLGHADERIRRLNVRLAERNQRLQDGERKYRTLVENVPQKIFYKDRDSVYISCNAGYAQDLGIHADAIAGQTDYNFFPRELADKYRGDDRRILESGRTEDIEERYLRAGEERTVHTVKTPVKDEQGRVIGVLGAFWDVTEQKRIEQARQESETRFRAIFEQAAVGMALVDTDGRWLRVNQRLCDIVGYTRDELLARTFQDITHPDDLEADLACVRRLLANEIPNYSMEKRYLRKDQSVVWVNLTVALVRDPAGKPKYFISAVEDRTLHKQVAEALDLRAREMERFNRLAVGREQRMIELKREINELRRQHGQPPTYDLSFLGSDRPKTVPPAGPASSAPGDGPTRGDEKP